MIPVDVSPTLLRKSIKLSLEHHIYIADSLQIASASKANATFFTTGDKELAKIAGIEGLKPRGGSLRSMHGKRFPHFKTFKTLQIMHAVYEIWRDPH